MPVLSEIFKECPQVRIIEIFAENQNEMLCLTDIEKSTGITRITIANHISKLLEERIIEKKGKDGRKQFYQINVVNPKVKILLRLEEVIISENLGDLIKGNKDEYTEKSDIKSEYIKLDTEENLPSYTEVSNQSIQNIDSYILGVKDASYNEEIWRRSDNERGE